MKLYIAGPMRGYQFYNFPAFDRTRDRLLALGHTPISPADLDRARGFDGLNCSPDDPCLGIPQTDNFELHMCIRDDTKAIIDADGICFISDAWYKSLGACAEALLAVWAKKRLFLFSPVDEVPVELSVSEVMAGISVYAANAGRSAQSLPASA